jgi:hypothetical protein
LATEQPFFGLAAIILTELAEFRRANQSKTIGIT